MTAIDCHAHVMRRNAPLAAERHSAPKRDVTVAECLGMLDRHGISHGVLTAPSFYGTDNRLLLEALDSSPERLRGTVIVAPDIEAEELGQMGRRGVVGIRLNWVKRASLPDVLSDEYQRLFRLVRELDWHVEVFLEGPKLASVLPRIRESGAKVVLDHFGCPDRARGVADPGFQEALKGVRARDTWVKLSAAYRLGGVDPKVYVDALLDAGGSEQLVWASDWPFVSHEDDVTYQQCLDALEAWIPDPHARRTVLAQTPAKLFQVQDL
jgi:predicted TIM-barrel fold metal-dependent hydrolase